MQKSVATNSPVALMRILIDQNWKLDRNYKFFNEQWNKSRVILPWMMSFCLMKFVWNIDKDTRVGGAHYGSNFQTNLSVRNSLANFYSNLWLRQESARHCWIFGGNKSRINHVRILDTCFCKSYLHTVLGWCDYTKQKGEMWTFYELGFFENSNGFLKSFYFTAPPSYCTLPSETLCNNRN